MPRGYNQRGRRLADDCTNGSENLPRKAFLIKSTTSAKRQLLVLNISAGMNEMAINLKRDK